MTQIQEWRKIKKKRMFSGMLLFFWAMLTFVSIYNVDNIKEIGAMNYMLLIPIMSVILFYLWEKGEKETKKFVEQFDETIYIEEEIKEIKILKKNIDFPLVQMVTNAGECVTMVVQLLEAPNENIILEKTVEDFNQFSINDKRKLMLHPVLYVPKGWKMHKKKEN